MTQRDYLLAPGTHWTPDERPSIWDILRRYEHQAPRAQVLGQGRSADIVSVRHAVWRDCWDAGYSFTAIALAFGRDPSTVRKTLGKEAS